MLRFRPFAFALVAFLVALACGTATFVVQQYKGEPMPRHLVAVLRLEGGDDALVVTLDGEVLKNGQLDPGTRVHVELLPGKHEVGLAKVSSESRVVQTARFRAEQGKFYRGRVVDAASTDDERRRLAPGSLWSPAVWEIDRDDDTWLVDVTLPPEEEKTEPAPVTAAAGAPAVAPDESTSVGGASAEPAHAGQSAVGGASAVPGAAAGASPAAAAGRPAAP